MSALASAARAPIQRVLHVLNYGWPYIDGYTVRSIGLITAQQRDLGLDVNVATAPFAPLSTTRDPLFTTPAWHAGAQIRAARRCTGPAQRAGLLTLERPGLGLAPASRREFHAELVSIVRRLAPDLIHVHHPHYVASVALDVARAFDLPCVYELRCFNGDYDLERASRYARARGHRFNQLEASACRRADAVVTIADGLSRRIVAAGVPADRVFVVRNSVDIDRFQRPADSEARKRSRFAIGYACTFSPIEGLDLLIEAVAQLSAAARSALQIVLAGDGSDRARIQALVTHHGLEDTVELPGFIAYADMPAFYQALDLFVVPRRDGAVTRETTPLKPLEARAAGVPMLVSDLPALRELLGADAPDVRYVRPEADAMARALGAFIAQPWQGAATMSSDRTWPQEVQRYRGIYARAQACAAGRTASPSRLARLDSSARSGLRRVARRVVDSGLPGTHPLVCHVVVCGFPRTGSTLLQLMIAASVVDVRVFDGEIEALWAARHALRNHRWMLTKCPRDIEHVEAIRRRYAGRRARPLFVFMQRDPRAVLTSRHAGYPDSRGYYVDFDRWRRVDSLRRALGTTEDVLDVRYEDLVRDPDRIQARLAGFVGWSQHSRFSDYLQSIQHRRASVDSMTDGALGGLRSVESSRIQRWRDPDNEPRLQAMLHALPELPERLIELGYEVDRSWCDDQV